VWSNFNLGSDGIIDGREMIARVQDIFGGIPTT
jgi:hypothetical protein